jgi:hypothetical protein
MFFYTKNRIADWFVISDAHVSQVMWPVNRVCKMYDLSAHTRQVMWPPVSFTHPRPDQKNSTTLEKHEIRCIFADENVEFSGHFDGELSYSWYNQLNVVLQNPTSTPIFLSIEFTPSFRPLILVLVLEFSSFQLSKNPQRSSAEHSNFTKSQCLHNKSHQVIDNQFRKLTLAWTMYLEITKKKNSTLFVKWFIFND